MRLVLVMLVMLLLLCDAAAPAAQGSSAPLASSEAPKEFVGLKVALVGVVVVRGRGAVENTVRHSAYII